MYESSWNQPSNLFGQFELFALELDKVFGVSGLPSSIRSVRPVTLPDINVGRTPSGQDHGKLPRWGLAHRTTQVR